MCDMMKGMACNATMWKQLRVNLAKCDVSCCTEDLCNSLTDGIKSQFQLCIVHHQLSDLGSDFRKPFHQLKIITKDYRALYLGGNEQ